MSDNAVVQGPGSSPSPSYNPALTLEVFVHAPTKDQQEDFETFSRSAAVQGLRVTVLPEGAQRK